MNENCMNGYFLVDKPLDISSFWALTKAKDSLAKESGIPFKKIKLGHAGTLDPLASGLLLCAVGSSTKMLSHLLLSDKKYIADVFLGENSETDDAEGAKSIPDYFRKYIPTREEIECCINKFQGKIVQVPPSFSALKIAGKRACDRVRAGEKVEMKSREVEIFSIKICEYSYPHLQLEVHCGSGTYIRSLARDIGKELKQGAYLSGLRRTQIGRYSVDDAVHFSEITSKRVFPFTVADFEFPSFILDSETLDRLRKGQKVHVRDIPKNPFSSENIEKCLLWDTKKQLVAMAEFQENVVIPRKVFF